MARIRVTKVRSTIKSLPKQKLTMKALGLNRMNQSREFEASAALLGSIEKVKHLVKIENI